MFSLTKKNQNNNDIYSKSNKVYTIIIALLPLLNNLPTPLIGVFTLANSLLIIMIPYVLYQAGRKKLLVLKSKNEPLIAFCSYAILSFLVGKLVGNTMYKTGSGIWVVIFTVSFLLIHAMWGSNTVFDLSLARKIMEYVTVLACVSILIQYISYYLFNNFIQMIPLNICTMENKIAYDSIARTGIAGSMFRPSAFFLEPSHFSQYALIGLLSLQYPYGTKKTNIFLCFFVTLGILMTTSGLGVVCSFIAWLMYIFRRFPKKFYKSFFAKIILGFIVGAIAFIIICQFDFFLDTINRIFTNDTLNNPTLGRISSISYYNELPLLKKIFGAGFGLEPLGVYFTGGVVTLYRIGIVGSIFFYYIIINRYFNTNVFCKHVCIIFIALYISGEMYAFMQLTFFSILIFGEFKDIKRSNEREDYLLDKKISVE